MLELFYSNRHETLSRALLDDLAAFAMNDNDPFASQGVIVPSAAVRRRLELDMAARFGICANVELSYLAQWLWAQIGGVLSVPGHSPFAPDRLVWRCYRLLGTDALDESARLRAYLDAADDSMRYELARRIATVFDHYLTYRPEWLLHWQAGGSILASAGMGALDQNGPRLEGASEIQREDERWQAALWRALLGDLIRPGDDSTPPAYRFLADASQLDLDAVMRAEWPERISVFALPTMPPLHIALLRELSRWIDVRIYAINPCREFWFDIVSEARVKRLELADKLDFQEVGHPLLAEWGRQTQAQLHMLHELTESAASREASHFEENASPTWLARVQNSILDLSDISDDDSSIDHHVEPGIEVHVCHGLSRQLEVLHDRLLGWFDDIGGLEPSDVLVAFPDLAAAGPLIDGVFGTAPPGVAGERRRIPYRITGLPPSQANPVARVLLDWLALPERSVGAPEMIEWLRVDAVAARYGIDAIALETAQEWLAAAGARRGLAPQEATAADVPAARHTFADALTRLFLGYALPDGGAPVDDWLPVSGAHGSNSELLGRLTRFIDDIDSFAERVATPRTPDAWAQLLLDALTQFFDASLSFADSLADVRATIDSLAFAMNEGAGETPISAEVLRAALTDALDDPARGGVPWGGVTFSSLTSLRGLPYRVVCLLGMDDGMLPSLARADEFDLMASFGKLGDRQRRDDERNLFLDLLLSARDRLLIAYTGRSIRDNAALPPAALIDELLDYLAVSVAGKDASPDELKEARKRFVFEHPLQPFAPEYFRAPLFTYEPERAELAHALALGRVEQPLKFFSQPLPAEEAGPVAFEDFVRFWRHPARALLRDRLGIALFDAEAELGDTEPFELEYAGRDALAGRVLPGLLELANEADPQAIERARRVARASPEMPGGATGGIWQARELGALHGLANRIRIATKEGASRLPFTLDIRPQWPDVPSVFGEHDASLLAEAERAPPMQLHGTLNLLTEEGQIIYRYDAPRARDYLSAWLAHLAYCAALPDGPRRTVWHGRGAQSTSFELTPVENPLACLATLAALYRAGRRLPLRFFPKSAWLWVKEGESKAQGAWVSERTRGESDDPALRMAFRGAGLTLDEPSAALARIVFEPLVQHLRSDA